MLALPTLVNALLMATISWAAPVSDLGATEDIGHPAKYSAVPPTPDLGINCRGSFQCGLVRSGASSELARYIAQIPDNAWYNNGQQIACTATGICAFLQNTGGSNGQWIKSLAPYIPAHRCSTCGSVPYFFARGDNDVSHGELTFNYVSDPCRVGTAGLCG